MVRTGVRDRVDGRFDSIPSGMRRLLVGGRVDSGNRRVVFCNIQRDFRIIDDDERERVLGDRIDQWNGRRCCRRRRGRSDRHRSGGSGGQPIATTMLPINQWVDVTPAGMNKSQWVTPGFGCSQPGDKTPTTFCTYGSGSVEFDFHAPGGGVDMYIATNMLGPWRQSSSGPWTQLGDPSASRRMRRPPIYRKSST